MTAVTANPSLGVPPDNSKSDPVVVVLLMRIIVLNFVIDSFCYHNIILLFKIKRENRTRFVRNNK